MPKSLATWRGICCLVLGFVLSLWWFYPPSQAANQPTNVKQLKDYQQKVENQKKIIQLYRDQLDRVEKPAQERLDALERVITDTEDQIAANTSRLETYQAQLTDLNQKLAKQETALNLKRLAVASRLRYLQRQEPGQWWAVLLSSQNLSQFSDRRRQLGLIYRSDRRLLAELNQSWQTLETQKQQIAKLANQISLVNQQLAHQKSGFETQAQRQREVVTRLRSDRLALEDAEDRLAQDSKQLTQLILAKLELNSNQPSQSLQLGSGQMIFPVIAPVTSNYGWRVHPILGTQKFHAGIDFGADYGTTIYAAARGRVIYAGWYGGYGNAVVIAHGNQLTTLYAHASELLVTEGQDVQQGQPIATVGSSGLSTGPHLHFEVRTAGEPTDPTLYL
ncbi:MAG: peptidoglycan DD-metalloendopeptidase family protein [Pseudanabaenaceae cyanobacterium bins.68]|nr:peptidoglycan DD-metalloendopeptidase family protein [Pseudanabaenaceae cyanobacterium bins.68]